MSYVENNLTSNEKVIRVAKNAWWALLGRLIFTVIELIVIIILSNNIDTLVGMANAASLREMLELMDLASKIKTMFWIIFVVSGILPVVLGIIGLLFNRLVITDKRVFGKRGIIARKTIDAPLDKVDSVTIKEALLGRLFNYAGIEIRTTSEKFIYPYVADAQEFKKTLMEAIEAEKEAARIAQAKEMAEALKANGNA